MTPRHTRTAGPSYMAIFDVDGSWEVAAGANWSQVGAPVFSSCNPRKSSGIDVLDQLTECVKNLVPNITPHTLDRFDLIEYDEHPG